MSRPSNSTEPDVRRRQLHDRLAGRRLAAARLADETERLAFGFTSRLMFETACTLSPVRPTGNSTTRSSTREQRLVGVGRQMRGTGARHQTTVPRRRSTSTSLDAPADRSRSRPAARLLLRALAHPLRSRPGRSSGTRGPVRSRRRSSGGSSCDTRACAYGQRGANLQPAAGSRGRAADPRSPRAACGSAARASGST